MLQQFKISFQAIIIFLFGILFLHAATATVVGAQSGGHSHREFRSLESQIQSLTQRVEALESAELTDAHTEPSASSEADNSPTVGNRKGDERAAASRLGSAVTGYLKRYSNVGTRTKFIEDAMAHCNIHAIHTHVPLRSWTCFCAGKHSSLFADLCVPFR